MRPGDHLYPLNVWANGTYEQEFHREMILLLTTDGLWKDLIPDRYKTLDLNVRFCTRLEGRWAPTSK